MALSNSVWGVREDFQSVQHQGLYLNDEFNWAGKMVCQGGGGKGNGRGRGRTEGEHRSRPRAAYAKA